MKKVLAIYFSQSGQLSQIIRNISAEIDADIEEIQLIPENPFPFPWPDNTFFHVMPETVLEETIGLKPIVFSQKKYDLILLGYQPWFLSPSLPVTSLLADSTFTRLLHSTPVVTVIGARNMWINAHLSVKSKIMQAGGKLVGNIPFIDRNMNLLSVISIVHWMKTGKKERKMGVFPIPGISQKDISEAVLFGRMISSALHTENYTNLQDKILTTGRININTHLLFIEKRAKKVFNIWAKKIKRMQNRNMGIVLFKYYLFIALFAISPLILTLYSVFIYPVCMRSINKEKNVILKNL